MLTATLLSTKRDLTNPVIVATTTPFSNACIIGKVFVSDLLASVVIHRIFKFFAIYAHISTVKES